MITEYKNKKNKTSNNEKDESTTIITLPWVPVLGPKLRKVYRNAGIKVAFKSGSNLKNILTSKNKCKLPPNSHPGVYKLDCDCGLTYIGETGCKISTRIQQHQKSVLDGKWESSGISEHAKKCHGSIDWNAVKTLTTQQNYFPRKVREALEIQKYDTRNNGMNLDPGNYVTSTFWKPLMDYINKK